MIFLEYIANYLDGFLVDLELEKVDSHDFVWLLFFFEQEDPFFC